MKKLIPILLGVSLLFISHPAHAIDVVIADQKLTMDQPPIIEQGRTLVPMREIFEAFGADVDWNQANRTVTATKEDTTIVLKIENTAASLNGKYVHLDVPGTIVNGRTMVPIRFIAESLGAKVNWYQPNQTVYINSALPVAPTVDSKLQKYINQYYIPPDPSDPVVGTWFYTESMDEYGRQETYDYYFFIRKVGPNQYSTVAIEYQKVFGEDPFTAITVYGNTAKLEPAIKKLFTGYETLLAYDGPARGFISKRCFEWILTDDNHLTLTASYHSFGEDNRSYYKSFTKI